MRKICIILLSSFFVHTLNSQILIQQIENAYNALDSASYIDNIILSFREEIEKQQKELDNTTLELYGFDYISMDSFQRQNILDSIDNIRRKSIHFQEVKIWSIEERINEFSNRIRAKTPIYVLNLIPQDKQTLQVDTRNLAFNLFYFDEDYKGSFFVYCKDGQYSWQDTRYRTFSQQLGVNADKVFKKIMQKQPKYLLYCSELEGMNTILYVLNDKIYVYKIVQMQEYELDDYIKTFGIIK
jgi:hypothetical protein